MIDEELRKKYKADLDLEATKWTLGMIDTIVTIHPEVSAEDKIRFIKQEIKKWKDSNYEI